MTMPEGKTWRGISVYQVLDRLDDAGKIAQSLFYIQQATSAQIKVLEREAAQSLIDLNIKELAQVEDPSAMHFGGWSCEDSPTDHCIYDLINDSWKDNCLFCSEPSDRG
jgi:hypothetical protein